MIQIGGIQIGVNHKPFIIAEMSGNHNQSLDRALEIVEFAAKSGAHAVKLQTYTADTLTLDISEGEFIIKDKDSYGKVNPCMSYIRRHIHHGNGTNPYLSGQMS